MERYCMVYVLLFLFSVFSTECQAEFTQLISREYDHDAYCHEHFFSRELYVPRRLLKLIPEDPDVRCFDITCSECGRTWVEENIRAHHNGEIFTLGFELFCDCKDAERSEYREENRPKRGYFGVTYPHYSSFLLDSWTTCEDQGLYPGYFDENFQKYTSCFFKLSAAA